MVEYLVHNLKVKGSRQPILKYFSATPPENSGSSENLTENSGPHARFFFIYGRIESADPVWEAEINITACNSVDT